MESQIYGIGHWIVLRKSPTYALDGRKRVSAFRNLNEALDKEKDLLTRRMGAKLQTLLHMAATFNRYII